MEAFEEGYAGTTGLMAEDQAQTDALEEIWKSSLVGSPEDVRDEVQHYVEAGCTFFELKFMYHSIDHLVEQLRTFSERVAQHFAY
jgi:alkanesulfonate monooxygenase SsuD/methylene tetrahydromethanopterin reductase-like flavin-dependent oxidoreductase (luciferase family)